ncbi:hypothetical protein SCUCBS95973_008907 [Sporothrix curviconia]|uniref:Uncharacterized protein n=1 Tax=Sporothrix curviconia TaxID=1260050 RepID=A0ABP0CQJ2_9PEZI
MSKSITMSKMLMLLACPVAESDDIKDADFTVDEADLPMGYFRSPPFLGSMLAIGVSFACGVGGFAFAAPILSYIDADIGPYPNLTWVALTYTLTTGCTIAKIDSYAWGLIASGLAPLISYAFVFKNSVG